MGSASSKAKAVSQDLRGKHYIVTGANSGMGYATSRELAKMGAKVTLACRNADRGEQAVEKLRVEALAKPVVEGVDLMEGLDDVDVHVELLDLGSLQSVVSFAQRFKASGSKVDALINNAGVMSLPERTETADGIEMQIGVNYFGGHLLTRLMEPMFADGGRVVFLSSVAHEQFPTQSKTTLDWDNLNYEKKDTYEPWMAYSRTKLATALDAKEFATTLAGRGINTYAVQPGVVSTGLLRYNTDSSMLSRAFRASQPLLRFVLATPLQGSLTAIRCAIDPTLAGPEFSGKYWGNMKQEKPSAFVLDPANSPRLWKMAEDVLEAKLGKKVDGILV